MEIQVFKNDRFGEVRTMVINDEPWFVGKDVASVLGYVSPHRAVFDHVDEDDKTSVLIQHSFLPSVAMGHISRMMHWLALPRILTMESSCSIP